MNQLVNLEDFTCNTMPKRPVVPKDLSKYPDFPINDGLSEEEYNKIIIAYWADKAKQKKKNIQKWKKIEATFRECHQFIQKYQTLLEFFLSRNKNQGRPAVEWSKPWISLEDTLSKLKLCNEVITDQAQRSNPDTIGSNRMSKIVETVPQS